MIGSIEQFLAPWDPRDLERAIRERQLVYAPAADPDRFRDLLPWPVLNQIIDADWLAAGRIKPMRRARALPLETMTLPSDTHSHGMLSPAGFQDLCHQGLSLVINAIGDRVPAIGALERLLERSLRVKVWTNSYVSFAKESAFTAHWDTHHVLIAQVAGRKRWFCYGQPYDYPVKEGEFPLPQSLDLARPAWQGVLSPGDLLFVPQGEIHRAAVEDRHSVHLTIGLRPPRGVEVLEWLARESLAHDFGRRDLNLPTDPEQRRAAAADLRAALHRLVEGFDLEAFCAADDRARPIDPVLNLGLSETLTEGTRIQAVPRRRVPLPDPALGEARVRFGDRIWRLSGEERAVLSAVMAGETLRLGDLVGCLPAIDVAETVAALARKGLVQLFPSAPD